MKKIKINEQQANMLKGINKTKVLKITQEQYNRILETEILAEGDVNMDKHFKGKARQEFKNTKVPGLQNEVYEAFINELYGNDINEGSEPVYEKLIKLLEAAGLITNGRLVKEKFQGNKKIVEMVISSGLDEMCDGASAYGAMEIIEEVLDLSKDYKDGEDLFKNKMDSVINKVKNNRTIHLYKQALNGDAKFVDVWRAYRASGESMLEEGKATKGIVGLDILKYPPMSQLKKNRRDKGTEVRTINLPSIHSLDGYRTIHSQSEFTGYNTENSLGKVIGFKGYIQKFKDMFKEEPIFEITSNNTIDFDIINPIYIKAKHNNSHGIPVEQDVDETTVAGSATTGGSSGSDVVAPLFEPIRREESNVVHELISDDVEIEVDNPLRKAVVGALEIINSNSVKPKTIVDNETELKVLSGSIGDYKDKEDNVINKTLPSIKRKFPIMINTLIRYADNVDKPEVYYKYVELIEGVYNILSYIKRNTNEDMMKDEVSETTITNSVGGEYATSGFPSSNFMGTKGKKGGTPVKTSVKPYMKDAKEVKVKEKCSEFPYCNQGPDAIEVSK